eukprot:240455-Rhodomonas_salina.1
MRTPQSASVGTEFGWNPYPARTLHVQPCAQREYRVSITCSIGEVSHHAGRCVRGARAGEERVKEESERG